MTFRRMSLRAPLSCALILSLGFGLVMPMSPVLAKDGNNANLLGGLAAGALVGGVVGNALGKQEQQQQPVYAAPPPAYAPPPPTIVQERVYVEDDHPRCHFENRKLFDEDGNFAGTRRVRVCH